MIGRVVPLVMVGAMAVAAPAVNGQGQSISRISVATGGSQGSGGHSDLPALSGDGRFVVFQSQATNLVPGDTNAARDIFVHDRQTLETTRVSVSSAGSQGNGHSWSPSISGSGRFVAFASDASNLVAGDINGVRDVFVHDRDTDQTVRVSVGPAGAQGDGHSGRSLLDFDLPQETAISADGRHVAFSSQATNLVGGDTNGATDIFVHDRQTGQTTRVSVRTGGTERTCPTNDQGPTTCPSTRPGISHDGRYVVFQTGLPLADNDTNNLQDVFVHDRQTGSTTRVSLNADGSERTRYSGRPALSADARYVVYEADLSVPGGNSDTAYRSTAVRDRQMNQTTTLLITDFSRSLMPAMSADGRLAVVAGHRFEFTTNHMHIRLFDRQTAQIATLSVNAQGGLADGVSFTPAISDDGQAAGGRVIAFASEATNLVPGDTNGVADVFVVQYTQCAIMVAPLAPSVGAIGGSFPITVTANPSSCVWTASNQSNWMSVPGSSFTGSQTLSIGYGANTSGAPRTGTLVIAGQTVTVSQAGAGACSFALTTASFSVPAAGGSNNLTVTTTSPCAWTAVSNDSWITVTAGASGTGTGGVGFTVAANTGAASRTGTLTVAGQAVTVVQAGTTAPGPVRVYLAEGATGTFFDTRLALFNPNATADSAAITFQRSGGSVVTHSVAVPARTRVTVFPRLIAGLADASFSTVVESSGRLVVDRTMTWDTSGYGSHAETAVPSPATTWYLAEGSTSGDFALFYLMQNANATATTATVRYLRPGGLAPIERTYTLAPNSRTTIPVDTQSAELASTDVSAVITAAQPIIVERAMYISRPGQIFAAGHESAGVTTPATTWFLAEGATGPFFDLFILVANPNVQAAEVRVDYLLTGGQTHTKTYAVPANGRFTIWVDNEEIPAGSGQRPLDNVAVSTTVTSTNGVPVIVERAMWWPSPAMTPSFWTEAHNSPGTTVTGTRWALAEGEAGGEQGAETYILIANTSAAAGTARVTLSFEDGSSATKDVPLLARSRTNVNVSVDFPTAAGRRFGAVIESIGTTPAQIVVERAMYTSPDGVLWAAGTNALATRLP